MHRHITEYLKRLTTGDYVGLHVVVYSMHTDRTENLRKIKETDVFFSLSIYMAIGDSIPAHNVF